MINEINAKCYELDKAIKLMGRYGREFALAERDYYVAKAQEVIKLQSEGVPATNIANLVKGHIAKELYDMELAKVMYETSKENINKLKTQIRVLEQQINMEWNQAGKE